METWRLIPSNQTAARQIVYIENAPMLVPIVMGLFFRSILRTVYVSTSKELTSLGLQDGEGIIYEIG